MLESSPTVPAQAGSSLFAVYVLAFLVAAVACFASVLRARRISDRDLRRGLVGLLLTSGGWAAAHVGFLTAPTVGLKLGFYYAGLIVGIATIGPWLYFCSAYTGRSLHRAPVIQRSAVAVFLAIVAVKVTNPLHGQYFQWEAVTTPFPHLAITNMPLHWLAMALAYALATVGYFMLLELFWQVSHDSKPLIALVGVTGLPVIFDVAALASPNIIDITYEPLGVAVFSVGALFVFVEDFQTIQFAGERDDPVIVLDDDDRVRDYNRSAAEIFPDVDTGEVITAIAPEIAEYLDDEGEVIKINRAGGLRYYQLTMNPFTAGETTIGQAITLTDITEREQYRSELERQNERLERFAGMISHDLRNPLNVAMGRLELAQQERDSEHLESVETALARMESLIDDLLTLARQGQPIDERERVTLATVANRCWGTVDTKNATLTIDGDLTFEADSDRLQQLLENLVRNAIEHGRDDVAITIGAMPDGTGFYVADDGPGIPEDDRDEVFESGYTTADEGTGFGLSIVEEIVDAHGWEIAVAESDAGGARFEIYGPVPVA